MIVPRLDSLPQELIDQIASEAVVRSEDGLDLFFQDKLADLANLSCTCRRLSVACAPTLFRRVTFRWGDTRVLSFLQSLISKPYLGGYVRVFKSSGGHRGGKEEDEAINEIAEEILKTDVDAHWSLYENPSTLWDIVTALTLRLLPELVELTTPAAVMQILSRWREEQRLQGPSISTLQVVRGRMANDNNYCKNMFGWKHAFRPGSMPAALHSLHLNHDKCQVLRLRGSHHHPEIDIECLHIAASLRRLSLESWLKTYPIRDCVPRLTAMLDKCTSLTHLTIIDDDARMLDAICKSTLTTKLCRLEVRMTRSGGPPLNIISLSQLSRFTRVTTLVLPRVEIYRGLESMVWPPFLESLILSLSARCDLHMSPLDPILKARQFPTSMQDITFRWFIADDGTPDLNAILDLIDVSQALEAEFASSGIVLLHEQHDSYSRHVSEPLSTTTDFERE